MKPWRAFFPFVLPSVVGCSEPTVEQHVRDAAIDFFTKSRSWIKVLSPVTTIAGQRAYAFGAGDGLQVLEVQEARINGGEPLALGFDDEITHDDSLGTPERIWSDDLASFNLWRTPAGSGFAVVNKCVIAPNHAATGIDDLMFDLYVGDIASNALATLLMLPGPWSNPQLAMQRAAMLNRATNRAGVQARQGGERLRTKRQVL